MNADYEKLKEELRAELLAELTTVKRQETAWRTAKKELRQSIEGVFSSQECWRVVDATAIIARAALDVRTVDRFSDDDVEVIKQILSELVKVCVKYKKDDVKKQLKNAR